MQNIIPGSSSTGGVDRVDPVDRRTFMAQHIPRLVSLAQLAESMGCEYFGVFADDVEN